MPLYKKVKAKLDDLQPYLETLKLDTHGRRNMPTTEWEHWSHYFNIETSDSSINGIEYSIRALNHLDKKLDEFIIEREFNKIKEPINTKEQNIRNRIKELKNKGVDITVNYDAGTSASMLFQLVFLKKYKYDCILSFKSHRGVSMAGFRVYLQKTKDFQKSTPESLAEVLYPKVKKCFENGSKIILVPLSLRTTGGGGHANVLIIKPEIMTAYRFEPHGEGLQGGGKDDDTINKLLEDMFKNKNLIKEIGNIKYVPPSETCPAISKSVRDGFQSMENQYFHNLSDKEQRRLKAVEAGGFCQAWSFFLIELYMMHPESTIEEIYIIAHDELENDPQSFRELIRGFITDVNKELKNFSEFHMGKKSRDIDLKILNYYDEEIKKLIEEQKMMAKEKHNKKLSEFKEKYGKK